MACACGAHDGFVSLRTDATRPPTVNGVPRWAGHAGLAAAAGIAVLVADAASKAAMLSLLEPGEAIDVVDGLVRWRLGFNTGIAFGILPSGGGVFVWLTGLIGIALIIWLLISLRQGASLRRTVPLALVVGGAFGNVLDRLPDGVVTDFIDLGIGTARWPSFNLADAAVVVGVVALGVFGSDARPAGRAARPD